MLLSIADNCITHHLVGKHETSQDNLAPGRKAAPSAGKKKHTPVFGSAWCSPRCSHALHGIHRMQNACRVPALIWGTDVEKKDVEKNTHTQTEDKRWPEKHLHETQAEFLECFL